MMNRRGFLKMIGMGAAVAATPAVVLAEREPVRRYWQVPGNAPVGGSGSAFDRYLADMARVHKQAFDQAVWREMIRESGESFERDALMQINCRCSATTLRDIALKELERVKMMPSVWVGPGGPHRGSIGIPAAQTAIHRDFIGTVVSVGDDGTAVVRTGEPSPWRHLSPVFIGKIPTLPSF